ncbi:MAG: lysophospholipase [Actinobacteria bacterium]|nr:lysophospholipase [Actinomycetota bacterium]MBU1943820.1 lysophospholipase [Actinomycetota bacterium]MBU2689019.1 lysophospholipase [Actinomycetota bacterium]
MAKRIRRAAGAAAIGMLGWASYSYKMMNKPLPTDEEFDTYGRKLFRDFGKEELWGTWREEVLQLEGRDLRLYHFESSPADPVMVFIPGTSVYALLYLDFMSQLSRQGFNVVGYDPTGHGKSSGKRGGYTLTTQLDDARAVITHAVETYNDSVAVSGSSQGGILAFYAAAAEPRLKAAVCHNLLAPDEPDNARLTRWPGLYGKLMPLLPLMVPVMATPLGELRAPVQAYLDLNAEKSRFVPDLDKFFREDPLLAPAISLRALVSLSTTPMACRVEEITTPVMVVHAGHDNIFPEDYVRRVYDRLTCSKEFLYLPDAYHLVMTDFVDEIMPAVAGWLKEMM